MMVVRKEKKREKSRNKIGKIRMQTFVNRHAESYETADVKVKKHRGRTYLQRCKNVIYVPT